MKQNSYYKIPSTATPLGHPSTPLPFLTTILAISNTETPRDSPARITTRMVTRIPPIRKKRKLRKSPKYGVYVLVVKIAPPALAIPKHASLVAQTPKSFSKQTVAVSGTLERDSTVFSAKISF